MIVEALANVFLAVAAVVVDLLPDGDPLGLVSASGIWRGYGFLNGWLPITEVLAGVGIFLGAHVALYAYLGIRSLWAMVPFKFS